MTSVSNDEKLLIEAFGVIENTRELELVVGALRDLLKIDHFVYHSSKFGASPSADPFIRLTYPRR